MVVPPEAALVSYVVAFVAPYAEDAGAGVLQSMTIEGLATALRKNLLKGGGDNGRTGISSITGLFGGND